MTETTPPVHLRLRGKLEEATANLQARLEEAELRARLVWDAADTRRARFAKVPERHRPYYRPASRFRILEIKNLLAWSAQEAARVFLVCPNTVLNWEQSADPEGRRWGRS